MLSVPRQVVAISPLPPIIARGQAGFPAQELREMAGISETFKKNHAEGGRGFTDGEGQGQSDVFQAFVPCLAPQLYVRAGESKRVV